MHQDSLSSLPQILCIFSATCCTADLLLEADAGTGLASFAGGYFLNRYRAHQTETTTFNGMSWPVYSIVDDTNFYLYRLPETIPTGSSWIIHDKMGSSSSFIIKMYGHVSCPENTNSLVYPAADGSPRTQELGTWSLTCDACK